jgi:UDP-N-acetylglucosamine 2-epimerase (non-hydrolysing)
METKMKIFLVAGARPNFMKIAPLWEEMQKYLDKITPQIIHTGQHYDKEMSDVFFRQLQLPAPEFFFNTGSGTHAEQTSRIMLQFERICIENRPDLIVVVGDVNSTLACSLTGAKLQIPVIHIEAGLRSFDRRMPEEINRIVTDAVSDLLFTTSRDVNENLKREGISEEKIYFVGNTMIDTLLKFKTIAEKTGKIKVASENYGVLTLHRPENVDNRKIFGDILEALLQISKEIPIIFPAHPRTSVSFLL